VCSHAPKFIKFIKTKNVLLGSSDPNSVKFLTPGSFAAEVCIVERPDIYSTGSDNWLVG